MAKKLTKSKAKKILTEGVAHGHKLTARQERFFQARAAGLPVRRKKKGKKQKKK